MGSDDGSAALGKTGHNCADFRVEGLEFVHIDLAIPIERAGILRIGLGKRGSNVVHVHDGIAEALPGMGVEGAMVMGFVIVVFGMTAVCDALVMVIGFVIVVLGMFAVGVVLVSDQVDAVGCNDSDTAEVRSVDQPVQPAFKVQPVDDKDLRFADSPSICRGRPVDMRIPVRTDERRDIDMLASDALHHVAEDRKGGHHRNRSVGLCDGRSGERQGENGDGGYQKRSASEH